MNQDTRRIVKAVIESACEVINTLGPELGNVRGAVVNTREAVESMDSDTQGELQKMNSKLRDIGGELEGIKDVLEEIRDLLKKDKRK